jgi:hypothetical protein
MRIIFFGNPYTRLDGARAFGLTTRFYNGLLRGGNSVFYYADREEARNAGLYGILKKTGIEKANRKLLKTIENIRPEALVFSHTGIITPETIHEIRVKYPDIRIAYLNIDALFCPKNIRHIEYMRDFCDAIFMTTGSAALQKYATEKCRFYFMPNITDRSMDTGRAFEIETPPYDVAAFMHGDDNHVQDQAHRLNLASRVASEIDGIKTFYRGFNGNPRIAGYDYLESLGQSGMTLCLNRHSCDGMQSTPETRRLYSSDRMAHVMGNGSLAIMSSDFDQQGLYSDKETVIFSSDDELVDKVRFYKNNSAARQAIAKAGWEKAHNALNEEIVMTYILERLFDKPLSRHYEWPTT